jgi:hypothetical protein
MFGLARVFKAGEKKGITTCSMNQSRLFAGQPGTSRGTLTLENSGRLLGGALKCARERPVVQAQFLN